MKKPLLSTGLRWLWLAVLVFIVDILSKVWVLHSFELYQSVKLLPFFSFTYVQNIGAAFSVLEGHRWPLAIIAVVICSLLMIMMYRTPASVRMTNIAFALIIGGALGNLSDRLYHGFVVDFLHFYIGKWSYPVFNLADVAICIGAGLIILDGIISGRREKQEKRAKAQQQDSGDQAP